MLLKNGTIYDAIHREPYTADILIRDGKIAAIGENLTAEAGEEVLDAAGLRVYPGMVEAHCHIGLDNYGLGSVGADYNEYNDALTPQIRGIDSYNPFEQAIPKALAAGVTTVCAGPGSSNVVGGTFVAIKTRGTCVDDMALLPECAMKCAFGENPKRCYSGKGISARMTTASKLREMLFKAREYKEKVDAAADDPAKKPGFDMKLEAMLPVMRGEMPLKAHAHRADDLCTAIRIAKEFGVKMTLEHVTEGHLIVNELVRAGFPVAVGPIMSGASKSELINRTYATPGILAKAGLSVSIITDSPVTGEDQLVICAAMAVKYGMDPFDALRAVTINPAKHIGVADRVGSIECGKDADLILADGDLLEIGTKVVRVILDGETAAIGGQAV